MSIKKTNPLPMRSKLISWTQFIDLTGSTPHRIAEVIEIGWIEPKKTKEEEYLFNHDDVWRLKKLTRICNDLGVSTLGGSIIVDLIGRIEDLEQQVQDLKRLL